MTMAAEVRWFVIFLLFFVFSEILADQIHRRFEYKYSFKPTYLAQKDGSVPFWEYGGNAIASSDSVRVAPSLRSQKGAIWTKKPTNFEWWEVDLVFRVTGRGRVGADGLAFWYTTSKGQYNGTVFGSSDQWTGLGIFFDSFDNDNKHNNPYIMGVINDGTKTFDHSNDGVGQLTGGCLRDFRNKPFPTKAKIEYYKNTLTVLFHNGMTNNEQDYEICFRQENIFLPQFGYFGVSAATGGLADDHDVFHFLTTSLHPPGQMPQTMHQVSNEDSAKINQEYQEYQKKMDQQKEEYKKEHPDEIKADEEEWYEAETTRELRQIFAVQSETSGQIREIRKTLHEIVGIQERSMSLISQIQYGGVQTPGGQPGQHVQPAPFIDTIRRQEVDTVLNNQNLIINAVREIKSIMSEINSKADGIMNHQARAPTAQVQPMGYDYHSLISEMRDGLNELKRDKQNIKIDTGSCPTQNCLTTTMFLLFISIQMALLLAYSLYKDNKEAQAKKFY
ncbi:protein ERGIC-53 [Leptopilina boulardi]|uniref:protein ERGIC-53 n=1 Tax=Leptopilina boulardi TaxID=63433 RepID=UPI0021F5ABD4|nr:protein ERGIC-53 [Leptopilina boulardi]